MALSDMLRGFFRKSPWKIFAAVCTGLATAIGAVVKVPDINSKVAERLSAAIYTDPKTHHYNLRLWFLPFEALALTLAAALLLLAILFIRQHYISTASAVTREIEDLNRALIRERTVNEDMMAAVKAIRNQAKRVNAPQALDSLTLRYFINRDLSATHYRQAVIRGIEDPILFWESRIFVSDEADSVDSLSAIHFNVRDLSDPPHKIVYLPTENQDRIKRTCLFFLPPIQRGESRRFELSYRWPGLFNRLKSAHEDFEYEELASEPIRLFRLEFYLQEGQGNRLHCEVNGPTHANQSLTSQQYSDPTGWKGSGYIYEVRDIPAGQVQFGLRMELRN